jgi:pimeloyl-ACP methyl ester carboxylesterase
MSEAYRDCFVEVGGVRIHCVRAGSEAGGPVLLLHGFPEFWWAWRKQISDLASAGFQVVAVDLKGYGQSDAPSRIVDFRLERLVGDIVGIAAALGWQRFDLVGHDWGGIIAWAVAARHPLAVKNLVVINAPHLDVMPEVVFRRPAQLLRSSYVGFFQIPLLPEILLCARSHQLLKNSLVSTSRPGTFNHDDLSRYATEWGRPGRMRSMLHYYRALVQQHRDPLGRIVPPTLLLWGCRDQALEFELAKASILKCANGKISVHRNATHWVHLEEPEWVSSKLVDFLCKDDEADKPEPGAFDETV